MGGTLLATLGGLGFFWDWWYWGGVLRQGATRGSLGTTVADSLLSLTTNRFGTMRILTASVRELPLVVHTGVSLRGDLWRDRGDEPYGVRVAKGIGSGYRLISALSLNWHDFGCTLIRKGSASRSSDCGERIFIPDENRQQEKKKGN